MNFLKSVSKSNIYIDMIPKERSNLLWIEGRDKIDYKPKKDTLKVGNITILIEYPQKEEPSIINPKLAVKECNNPMPLGYYPSYEGLDPCQRYTYLKWLEDITQPIDIGYVFIYYYGLERELMFGNFEEAVVEIDILRQHHKNSSFLHYSSEAIILGCFYNNQISYFDTLVIPLQFSELFVFTKALLNERLYPLDIINSCSYVGYKNKKYIKEYFDLFQSTLVELLNEKYSHDYYKVLESDIKKSPIGKVHVFANISFDDDLRSISIFKIFENRKIKEDVYNLLIETHGIVKSKLKEMRKNNKTPKKSVQITKPKKKLDTRGYHLTENDILMQIDDLKDELSLHFAFMNASNFYYKYREMDGNLEKAKLYAEYDIQLFPKLHKLLLSEFKTIPSLPMFNRLAIIYEKLGRIDKAIQISEMALKFVNTNEADNYKNKLIKLKKKVPKVQIK